ncbi:9349_t:CDS:2, partial [Scutellospora calospora]
QKADENSSQEIEAETSEEEMQSGAYDPETGEINWDCPCLGGMAKGPCGEEFKAAFSCFIYSKAEQKGADCLDAFREMNECFKKYPDVYKDASGLCYEPHVNSLVEIKSYLRSQRYIQVGNGIQGSANRVQMKSQKTLLIKKLFLVK